MFGICADFVSTFPNSAQASYAGLKVHFLSKTSPCWHIVSLKGSISVLVQKTHWAHPGWWHPQPHQFTTVELYQGGQTVGQHQPGCFLPFWLGRCHRFVLPTPHFTWLVFLLKTSSNDKGELLSQTSTINSSSAEITRSLLTWNNPSDSCLYRIFNVAFLSHTASGLPFLPY